jgi:hypothetical protein
MTDNLDREVLDLLVVVIAGAPRCRWGRRHFDGTLVSLPCDRPAVVYAYDIVSARHSLACESCAGSSQRRRSGIRICYNRHPTSASRTPTRSSGRWRSGTG